ncbi:MAG: HAD-IB family phosphatase [candidate division Zixibacteria bacterium]|nr:HAD-IB family phosphatase [candidate division Zixibacteria bacterium]
MKIKAVFFDLDGTIIRNTDSVRYLCIQNDRLSEFEKIECLEDDNNIPWIEADYLKAELIKGLSFRDADDKFDDNIELIQNLEMVLTYLKEKGVKSVLITAGPIQVANILGTKFDFDGIYGSQYELKDQKFTGKILSHLGSKGKVNGLNDFCANNSICLNQCVAIGDSESDIDIFKKCSKSIAINYSDALKGKASDYIITDDLSDIIDIIESWLAE